MDHLIARLGQLLDQGRTQEALVLGKDLFGQFPESPEIQYLLAVLYCENEDYDGSIALIAPLYEQEPNNVEYLTLLTEIKLQVEQLGDAETMAKAILELEPASIDGFLLLCRIKFSQRNYDRALYYAEEVLAIEPENLTALNLKTSLSGLLGRSGNAQDAINDALERDPNNPYTLANLGMQQLNSGKVRPALETFKDVLMRDPSNELARYGMAEALKSKFLPYRLFYKFSLLLSIMSGGKMWIVIIGVYLLSRFLQSAAESYEALSFILWPLVFVLFGFILLSWLINPLMNIYLSRNEYGRMLLDDDDNMEAKYSGLSLIVSTVFLVLFLFLQHSAFFLGALFHFFMLIPLGSMRSPIKEEQKKRTTYFAFSILLLGELAILFHNTSFGSQLLTFTLFSIVAYQLYLNAVIISSTGRTFGE